MANGLAMEATWWIHTVQLVTLLAFLCYELWIKGGWKKPEPVHLYTVSLVLSSIANLTAYFPVFNKDSYVFSYGALAHIPEAAWLGFLGGACVIVGMLLSRIKWSSGSLLARQDIQHFTIPFIWLVFSALLLFIADTDRLLPGLVGYFFKDVYPLGIIFYCARCAIAQKSRPYWVAAFTLSVVCTVYKVLHSFLRVEMVLPSIALLAGFLTADHFKFRQIFRWPLLILYIFLLIFIQAFPWMKNNRGLYGNGLSRVEYIANAGVEKVFTDYSYGETVLTRLSLLNQQSQAVRIAREEGFYSGKTLDYLSFVFIPRFLWPDKPAVNRGAWFAYKIDQHKEGLAAPYGGNHTWSANMTIPGELFLNFGWWGVVIGGLLIGWMVNGLWISLDFYGPTRAGTVWRHIFGFYLLLSAFLNLGADLQFLINIIAYFLITILLVAIEIRVVKIVKKEHAT